MKTTNRNEIIETYQLKVQSLLVKLIQLNELTSDKQLIFQIFDILTKDCLSYPLSEKLPQCSWICGDFTPIQFSVSLSQKENIGLRYITEITKPFMLLPSRVILNQKRLPSLFELIDAKDVQQQILKVMDIVLPQSCLLPHHPPCGIWVGVQHKPVNPVTLRIYFHILWELGDPWHRFYKALEFIDPRLKRFYLKTQKSLHKQLVPNAIGLEYNSYLTKVKLYLRSYQLSFTELAHMIEKLDFNSFLTNGLGQFNDIFLNGFTTYIPFSMIFSIGVTNTGIKNVKVEIAPQYYMKDDIDVQRRVETIGNKLNLKIESYEKMLTELTKDLLIPGMMCYHDVVGISFSQKPRLNVYLRPNLLNYYKQLS